MDEAWTQPARSRRPPKMVYLAPSDIQVARVERQMLVNFCSALAEAGVDVELVALGIRLSDAEKKNREEDPLSPYVVTTRFPVDVVWTHLHQDSPSWLVGLTRLRVHVEAVLKRLRRGRPQELMAVYLRNFLPALVLLLLRRARPFTILFEIHLPPRNRLQRFVLGRVDCVVANTHALARDVATVIPAASVLPMHMGIDLRPYAEIRELDKTTIRRQLGLNPSVALAVYTGKIYAGYKEVELIVEAATMLPAVQFLLVGGREDHVERWREEVRRRGLANVTFTGFVRPREVHLYHAAGDVLVLYYAGGDPLNAYRSPGKLFGYMASGVPIVAGDLPVLREVLGDPPAAFLVRQDAPGELARAIRRVLDEPELARRVALEARERVEEFTWDERARRLIEFVGNLA